MKVFILEDGQERIDFFNAVFKDDDIFITDDVEQAIRMLSKNKYDLIMLDHDVTDKEGQNGYKVACSLEEYECLNHTTKIIVHSMNPVGARNILRIGSLDSEWIPFDQLVIKDIKNESF